MHRQLSTMRSIATRAWPRTSSRRSIISKLGCACDLVGHRAGQPARGGRRHTGARPRPGELVRELGRVADVTWGMLPLTVAALGGLFAANPDVSVGLFSDIVGEG